MAELPDLHKLTAAQTLRMLALQEARSASRPNALSFKDEMIDAIGAAVAKLCEAFPDEGAEIAARIRDLMFDRKKRIDRASPL